MAGRKAGVASKEGLTVLTDADLKAGVEARMRQLEAELAGQRMLLAEAQADPHDDSSEDTHSKSIESLEARLKVTKSRYEALKANTADDDEPGDAGNGGGPTAT